jgi:enamine deaminase RidA (YjgF/YER057c/UK114 family)
MLEPDGLPPARGFSHAVAAEQGRTVWVAGQIATDAAGTVVGETWAEQFDVALGNVVVALRAGGAEPHHVVAMQIFTTDVAAYREASRELSPVYREHMGRHYPAMALVGVTELVEPAALIEITATAVVPAGD